MVIRKSDTYRAHKQLRAVEANASHYLDSLGNEADVEDRLGEVDMAEVSGTLCHIAGAGLAAGVAVNDTLAWVHEPTQLRPPTLHGLREADSPLRDGHTALED